MRNFDVSFAVSLKNVWTNSRVAGDLRRHNAHVMLLSFELLKSLWLVSRILTKNKLMKYNFDIYAGVYTRIREPSQYKDSVLLAV